MKEESFTFLGKETTLKGSVETSQLILEGSIDGDVKASNEVFLKNGSLVTGDILTKKIVVEEGYEHNGNIKLNSEATEKKSLNLSKESERKEQEEQKKKGSLAPQDVFQEKDSQRLW